MVDYGPPSGSKNLCERTYLGTTNGYLRAGWPATSLVIRYSALEQSDPTRLSMAAERTALELLLFSTFAACGFRVAEFFVWLAKSLYLLRCHLAMNLSDLSRDCFGPSVFLLQVKPGERDFKQPGRYGNSGAR